MRSAVKRPALSLEISLLVAIVLLAFFVRFFNYANRITFGPEQAISLITSAEYIQTKFSLLGQPNVQRVTSEAHVLFSGSLFNYSLVPLLLVFQYNPLPITAYFTMVNILTGVAILLVGTKLFSFRTGTFAAILFLFNEQMINLSLYIWILHYLPLIGLMSFVLLWYMRKKPHAVYPFALGVLSGIGFNLEYFYVFTALFVYAAVIYFSTQRPRDTLLYIGGAALSNVPMIVFDVHHQFYHVLTLWQYTIDTLKVPGQSKISPYHFYQYWPILALLGGYFLSLIYRWEKYASYVFIILYIGLIFVLPGISFTSAVGMPPGLTVAKVDQAARAIATDHPTNFNVASLFDFDTRAHPLRYFLTYQYHSSPNGVDDYADSQTVYVFAPVNYDFDKAIAYEVNVFPKNNRQVLTTIDPNYAVFKIKR